MSRQGSWRKSDYECPQQYFSSLLTNSIFYLIKTLLSNTVSSPLTDVYFYNIIKISEFIVNSGLNWRLISATGEKGDLKKSLLRPNLTQPTLYHQVMGVFRMWRSWSQSCWLLQTNATLIFELGEKWWPLLILSSN